MKWKWNALKTIVTCDEAFLRKITSSSTEWNVRPSPFETILIYLTQFIFISFIFKGEINIFDFMYQKNIFDFNIFDLSYSFYKASIYFK